LGFRDDHLLAAAVQLRAEGVEACDEGASIHSALFYRRSPDLFSFVIFQVVNLWIGLALATSRTGGRPMIIYDGRVVVKELLA
jgi:hypothetical protein